MQTGYFARASEAGLKQVVSGVHLIERGGKPLCGYKPAKGMQFMFCASRAHLPYVNCKVCKRKFEARQTKMQVKAAHLNWRRVQPGCYQTTNHNIRHQYFSVRKDPRGRWQLFRNSYGYIGHFRTLGVAQDVANYITEHCIRGADR